MNVRDKIVLTDGVVLQTDDYFDIIYYIVPKDDKKVTDNILN